MKTAVCVVLLGLAALAAAEDRYQPEKEGSYKQERFVETRSYGRQEAAPRYAPPRSPYYGGPYYMGEDPNNIPSSYHRTNRNYRGGRYYYGGSYKGKCYQDGLYYMDRDSFVLCSNGNAYVQPCAPGTRNSERSSFRSGYYYGYSDFCDVNLVDFGYGPQHYAAPYKGDDKADGYGEPKETGYGSDDSYKPEPAYPQDRYPQDNYETDSYAESSDSYAPPKTDYAPKDDYKPEGGYKKEETYVKESYGDNNKYYQ